MSVSREETTAGRRKAAQNLINLFKPIPEEDWGTGSFRQDNGRTCCAIGHTYYKKDEGGTFTLIRPEATGVNLGWDPDVQKVGFSKIFNVNDKTSIRYNQATPKKRVIAFLRDIVDGRE